MINICPVLKSYQFFQVSKCQLTLNKVIHLKFSTSVINLRLFRSYIKFKHKLRVTDNSESTSEDDDNFLNSNLDKIIERSLLPLGGHHQVFVIQPVIKWGQKKKRNTTPELQLEESITLVKTLRNWKVVGEAIVKLESFNRKTFFGKGNLQLIRELILKHPTISAVFLSTESLKLVQQKILEEMLTVPVFDRYTLIMHILREHAKTREAKLQIKLAELPYLYKVMGGLKSGYGIHFFNEITSQSRAARKEIFKEKEAQIRNELSILRKRREELRNKRKKNDMPVIAVVGYTNAGKTSLVKALTGKEKLEPKDYLFATLDVTCHIGTLPSSLPVYFVDTLGFMNDIPTFLIESFVYTLEDVKHADVIIHVRDISHPNTVAQNDNVIQTLHQLNLSDEDWNKVITVGNKIDKIEKENIDYFKDKNMILVSCTDLTGIEELRQKIEKFILLTSDKKEMIIKVKSGLDEYNWLHTETTVTNEWPDSENNQYMFLKVIISPSTLSRFKSKFIYENLKKK